MERIEFYRRSGEVITVGENGQASTVEAVVMENGLGGLREAADVVEVVLVEDEEAAAKDTMDAALVLAREDHDLADKYPLLTHIGGSYYGSEQSLGRAFNSLTEDDRRVIGEMIDALLDDYVWSGWFPKPAGQRYHWRYGRDFAVKRYRESKADYLAPWFQRLLMAWELVIQEVMGRTPGQYSRAFNVGFVDSPAAGYSQLSIWGGRHWALLNPSGFKASYPMGVLATRLRDRAVWVVAHTMGDSYSERWIRRIRVMLEGTVELVADLAGQPGKESPICWLNSVGASMWVRQGGRNGH